MSSSGFFDLELKIDKCKFYPLKPLAVIAGNVIEVPTIGDVDQTASVAGSEGEIAGNSHVQHAKEHLKIGTRCLVYVNGFSRQIPSLIERFASECREKKKCTNWIDIAEHRATCRIDIDVNSTDSILDACRSVPGAWMLRSSKGLTQICNPPTVEVTIMMDQSKFYPTKLAILDGVVQRVNVAAASNLTSKAEEKSIDSLHTGERCWLHVRSNVVSLLKALHGDNVMNDSSEENKEKKQKNKIATGWVQLARSIPITCRVIINNDLLERKSNAKGALILECYEVLEVPNYRSFDMTDTYVGDEDKAGSRVDRKERHRIFAEWLVATYGTDFLSTGSGVLDVAGGNGELSQELFKLGVKSTLLDPDPRCNEETVPFQVISEPLMGNGSELTEENLGEGSTKADERRRIRHLVKNCSMIAGMHPDEATEAVIDTSLRLGKPFAILPCCVFRNLNLERQEIRKQKQEGIGGSDPFRSYSTFCHYLLWDKAPPGIRFQTQNLPFEGRNKVVYTQKDSFQCQEIIYS